MISFLKNILVISTGIAYRWVVDYGFDFVAYPIVLAWFGNEYGAWLGSIYGGGVLVVAGTVINVITIWLYDWTEVDWFLIEKLKQLAERDESDESLGWWLHQIVRLLKLAKRNKVITFLVLCLDDPVTVTLFFREGIYQYNGMSKRDWKIFLAANVVANLYWTVIVGPVVVLFAFVKDLL